MSENVIGD